MLPLVFTVLFLCFILYFGFGIYTLVKMPKSLKNRMFFSICVLLSLWSVGYAFMCIAPTQERANIWRMVASVGWCFVYSTWLDFAILIQNNERKKWMTDIRRLILYLPSFFFLFGNLKYRPDEVIERYIYIWRDTYPIRIFETLFCIFIIGYVIAGAWIIYKWGKKSVVNREKKQANSILTASIITFILSLLPRIFLSRVTLNLFPIDILIFLIMIVGIYHAMTKYRMMTIKSLDANDYIIGNINDPIILTGNDLLIKEVNKATLVMTGFDENELVGHSLSLITSEQNFDQTCLDTLRNGGHVNAYEVGLRTKGNATIHCLFSGGLVINEFNDILGMACIFHDITDRKKAENLLLNKQYELENIIEERTKELNKINSQLMDEIKEREKVEISVRSSEERLRTFIKISAEGIIVIAQDRNQIIECNDIARKIFSLTGVSLPDMMHEISATDQYNELAEAIQKIISNKSMQLKKTIKINSMDGSLILLDLSATRVSFNEKQYIIITVRDITDQSMMEERKQQIAKMEALGTLSGGIAHDFNNILAGIMGYTQLMLEECGDNISLEENLTEVLKLGERAKNIITQILTFSRKSLSMMEKTDLREITGEVVNMLKTTLPSNISLQFNQPDTPFYVKADKGEMHQLITNLCVNSKLAFDGKNGLVSIYLSELEIKKTLEKKFNLDKAGEYIQIVVEDNGCGMDDEIKKRIFEPFFSKRGSNKGTGLGLSIVHGIVIRMEGTIIVDSELDKGSKFTILLPKYKDSDLAQPIIGPSAEHSAIRILMVDDEETIVVAVKKLLSRHGYIVTGVTSPREAITLFSLQPNSYDILLTDQSMPVITGDELLKELRRIRPELPSIICSGFMRELYKEEDDRVEYLMKPVAVDDYIAAIEKLHKTRA